MSIACSRPIRWLGGFALAALLNCVDATGESGALRIRIVNEGTGLAVRVVVDGPRFDPRTLDVASGATVTTYPTGGSGDLVTFVITVPANSALRGEGSCTAGIAMSPGSTGDTHGQVNLMLEGSTIRVDCSSGWD